jgi:hypothetical protein
MPLGRLRQDDFSAGMFRSLAPQRIPANGCYDLQNFLIDNEGSPYQRGGSAPYANPAASSDFTNVYDALLELGRRTLWSTKTQIGVLDPADGLTPITLEPPGYFIGIPEPRRGTVLGGRIYIDGGLVYAGTTKPGEYGTGTVAVTQDSKTVVGSGTAWLANVGAGMILNFAATANYVVAAVTDDTHLELTAPYKGAAASGQVYLARSIGAPHKLSMIYGSAGRRLLAVGDRRSGETGDTVYFSRNQDPINEVARADGTFQGIQSLPDEDPENFHVGDFHQIPGSPDCLGLASWGDTAIVFTTGGVWLISNMDLEPVDDAGNVQQSLVHSAPQIVLWHRNGIAGFEDAWIVPARDGIYIMGKTFLERLDTPLTPLYRDYFRQGLTLGLATVFEGHYLLPILSGTDAVDLLVCRLDRPVRTSAGTIRPWSHFSGPPVRAYCKQETAGSPNLLIASTGNRLLRGRYFEPAAVPANDNGTLFTSQLVTRDLATGNGNMNVVREIDADYDLVDTPAGDNPTLVPEFATGHPAGTAPYTTLTDVGPEGTDTFKRWLLPDPPRTRLIRVRLRSQGKLASLLVRSLSVLVRQSTKND